jgi:thiazole/oxazole-forming peptide maturase SagD family component
MPIRPLQVLPAVPVDGSIQIRAGSDIVTVENQVDAIWAVLRFSNGRRETAEVVEKAAEVSGLESSLLEEVVGDLERLGVLADSRTLHPRVMAFSDNPMPYSSDMRFSEYVAYEHTRGWEPEGEVISLEEARATSFGNRRSCRGYQETPVPMSVLSQLLQAATDRPPSAGALYPIRLALILNRPTESWGMGAYHYVAAEHGLVPIAPVSTEELRYVLNREDGIFNAPAVVVIAGDMNRQTTKYSNRGWRYTLIEAGIAVDRIVNSAHAADLGSLVFGGYDDVAMSRLLYGKDAQQVRSIVAVALGRPSNSALPDLDLERLHNLLDVEFVGDGRLVEHAGPTDFWRRPGDLSFHQVLATAHAESSGFPTPLEDRTCSGTAASIIAARAKAIVECIERNASEKVRVDRVGPGREVNPGFELSAFAPLSPEQVDAHAFLQSFDPDVSLQWVSATDLQTGKGTFVPVDLVFYPLSTKTLGRPLLYAANSSGIAAHTDPAEAQRRALLELIERHTVLTSWHEQCAPVRVPTSGLSDYLRRRREYWRGQGYDLHLLDYSTDGIPVAGVIIGSDATFPAFAFGSAAATTWSSAVLKAFQEAEVGIAGHRSLREDPIPADSVRTPLHHGTYHAYDPNRVAWTFLLSSATQRSWEEPAALFDLSPVIDTYLPLAVRIDSPEPIHTWRVLSPRVFPVSFGRSLEHRPAWSKAPKVPHFIA